MIKIILQKHRHTYPVSDVLRLFCDNVYVWSESEVRGECSHHAEIIVELNDGVVSTRCDYIPVFEVVMLCHDDKEIKREIKRQLYSVLSHITGLSFPWGALTGIRPTLVAREVKSVQQLTRKYFVREDKAERAMQAAKGEDDIIDSLPPDMLSLYVGIPFCPSKCSYCSFITNEGFIHPELLEQYVEALTHEISKLGELISRVESIYVGGGTPTVLNELQLYNLLDTCVRYTSKVKIREFTVEAGRPETINETKLKLLKDFGVSRICINPQTLSDETLKRIGRKHSARDFYEAFEMAQSIGFDCVNTDMIVGLPGETNSVFKESMDGIISLQPDNITIHTLYKKRTAQMQRKEVLSGQSAETVDYMIHYAHTRLDENGYYPYYLYKQKDTVGGHENIGYALSGKGCIYNVAMMSDCFSVLAVGAGSVSKRTFSGGRLERCGCVRDPAVYISRVDEMAEKKRRFFYND